jgi:hypothetical protein
MMTEPEVHRIIQQLRLYRDRMTELMNLADEKQSFTADERERLKDLFAALKDDLTADSRNCQAVRNRNNLSEPEKTYFCPAVMEASADIHVPVSSHPSNWCDDLFSACVDIDYVLQQLEELFPEV